MARGPGVQQHRYVAVVTLISALIQETFSRHSKLHSADLLCVSYRVLVKIKVTHGGDLDGEHDGFCLQEH